MRCRGGGAVAPSLRCHWRGPGCATVYQLQETDCPPRLLAAASRCSQCCTAVTTCLCCKGTFQSVVVGGPCSKELRSSLPPSTSLCSSTTSLSRSSASRPDPNLEHLQPEKQPPCFFQYQDKCAAAVSLTLRVPASSEFTYDLLLLLKLFLFVTYIEFYKELIRRWPPRILLR